MSDALLDPITEAARVLADAVQARVRAEVAASDTERSITESLIGSPNPLTNKPHSATSAADAAKATPEVRAAREAIASADYAVTIARGHYEVARLRAWLAVGVAA